jgi:hypothetical protein
MNHQVSESVSTVVNYIFMKVKHNKIKRGEGWQWPRCVERRSGGRGGSK